MSCLSVFGLGLLKRGWLSASGPSSCRAGWGVYYWRSLLVYMQIHLVYMQTQFGIHANPIWAVKQCSVYTCANQYYTSIRILNHPGHFIFCSLGTRTFGGVLLYMYANFDERSVMFSMCSSSTFSKTGNVCEHDLTCFMTTNRWATLYAADLLVDEINIPVACRP